MSPDDLALLTRRQAGFDAFYEALIPTLVEFAGLMGVQPAHEVLTNANAFIPSLEKSLRDMAVSVQEDRAWLLLRVGQFIGEAFVQKYSGCWYVNDIEGSRYFARYVVGRFTGLGTVVPMLDPFEVAQAFVDTPGLRNLQSLLDEVDAELVRTASSLARDLG